MRETGAFRYDAFISYRHVAPDAAIAERLHGVLEQYLVPRVLVRQGLPRRLTRDKGVRITTMTPCRGSPNGHQRSHPV